VPAGPLIHLPGQAGIGQRLLHQPGQLLPLLRAERGHQPLGRHRPADQGVDQFLQVGRGIGEHVAIALHERVEVGLGVLAARIGRQHRVELGQHFADPAQRLRVGVGQHVSHALELAVQDLPPEQIAELAEGFRRGRRAPLVVRQPPDGLRGVVGQRVQFRFPHPGIVGRVGEQLGPLLPDRGVQQRPGLLQNPVQAAAAPDLPLPLPHLAQQVVQATPAPQATPQQVAQGAAGIGAGQDRIAELVQRPPGVIRRRQRVRPVVVSAVAVARHAASFLRGHVR